MIEYPPLDQDEREGTCFLIELRLRKSGAPKRLLPKFSDLHVGSIIEEWPECATGFSKPARSATTDRLVLNLRYPSHDGRGRRRLGAVGRTPGSEAGFDRLEHPPSHPGLTPP